MPRSLCRAIVAGLLILCALTAPAKAAFSVITLAGQSDPDTHRGCFLNLENNRDGDAPLTTRTLKLTLSVGDGTQWTSLSATLPWTFGHTYTVQATLGPTTSRLVLDGQQTTAPTHLVPAAREFVANDAIDWANPNTEYWVVENSVVVRSANATRLTRHFTLAPSDIRALFFSARQPLRAPALRFDGTSPVTLRVTFTLVQRPADPAAYAPLVDPYGQVAGGSWPGKIVSDTQLVASAADEQKRLAAMPGRADVDLYGGLTGAGWRETPTGFYRVTRRRGCDWLITPTGYPCFYTAVCTAPLLYANATPISGRETLFARLPPQTPDYAVARQTDLFGSHDGTQYAVFDTANMITKYGKEWQATSARLTAQRLRSWGFAGLGKWSDPPGNIPYLVVLGRDGVPTLHGKPDIFDPAVRARLTETLAAQVRVHASDPFLVGWSLGNEHDEIVEHDTIVGILGDTQATPAKKALVEDALQEIYGGSLPRMAAAWNVAATASSTDALLAQPLTVPAADLETLRRFFADRYYACVYDTVKALDPHHLYLGFWIVPTWWENEFDWTLSARHCDVLGYDYYAEQFADPTLQRLIREADKPVFCGEFGYPPIYDAGRGFGLFRSWTVNDADAARHYQRWMQDASRNPHCIGGSWFEYRDEPVTGRGPGRGTEAVYGENYAFGLIDLADRPKWDLVTGVRAANRAAAPARLRLSAPPTP